MEDSRVKTGKGSVAEEIRAFYTDNPRVSPWLEVTQEQINRFADATLDHDWMHIDPERARREGPFGGTVAFGFWTLSMLTHFHKALYDAEYPPGIKFGLNYGFDRVRLMAPVPVGSRIRNRTRLLDVTDKGNGQVLVRTENTIEIEDREKPAAVAEWLTLLVAEDA